MITNIKDRIFSSKIFSVKEDENNGYGDIYYVYLTVEVGDNKIEMTYRTTDWKEIYKLKIKEQRGDTLGFYAKGEIITYIEYYL